MKMISAGAAAANQYGAYVYNCTRNAACEASYSAPLPSVSALQLFVDFGATQPGSVQFTFIDTCNNSTEQIFPAEFVVAQTPELNWYGVFRGFNNPAATYTAFVIHLSASGMSFFSQMLSTEPCGPLLKLKSCHPERATTTGFDLNGVYYGLPDGAFAGSEIYYTHTAWLRQGKVRELNDKATFKSNLYFNSRTTVEKIHQIQSEIVPKWYKDVLLALYSRGMVSVNDAKTYLVSDLNFEALNDDDLQWKPQAQLKETFRLFFGCDEFCVLDPLASAEEPGSEPGGSGSEAPSISGQLIVTSTSPDSSIVGLVNVTNSNIDYPVTATVDFGTWTDFLGGNIQVNLSVQESGFGRLLKNGIQIDIQPYTEFQGFVTFTGVAAYADTDIMEINVQPT